MDLNEDLEELCRDELVPERENFERFHPKVPDRGREPILSS
jgi:hypothetical protein